VVEWSFEFQHSGFLRISAFDIRISFVIRHLAFVIPDSFFFQNAPSFLFIRIGISNKL